MMQEAIAGENKAYKNLKHELHAWHGSGAKVKLSGAKKNPLLLQLKL